MAYIVSDRYKQIIYSGDAKNKIKILFNNVELQEADRYCERATIKSRIIPNGAKRFSLNNFISKEAELILHDIDTSIIQDKVSISIGTLVGNSYEYVPIGIFNIQGTPTTDKNKITIKLRDNSVKFDFNYNAKPLIDEKGGSATKLQILQDICSKAGVTCNITSFIGSTDRIGIYDNTITARQYIADLAEQAGRIATINRSGELIFVNINSLTTWNIPLSIVERYELGKAYRIGKVVYEDAIRKYETASTNYDTLYLDSSNPYISSQEQVNSILQQVNNFAIDSVKTGKILGNPAIDSYDLINIYNDKVEGNPSVFKTLATSDLVYNGVLINTFDTQIGEEERKENVSIVGEATFKKWAKTEIDNINGEVLIQAGKIDNVEKEINPTDTASGSSIYLEDSAEAELIDFEVEGKTEQETSTQGANLFDENYYKNATYINSVYKYTLTNIKGNRTLYFKAQLKPGGSAISGLYLSISSTGGNPNDGVSAFAIRNGVIRSSGESANFTNKNDIYLSYYPTSIAVSDIFNNYNLWISTNNINYEPFVPDMPSPDYPSELVSVGYENLTQLNNYTNNVSNVYFVDRKFLDNFENNTTYTLSFDITSNVEPFRISIGYGNNSFQQDLNTIRDVYNGHVSIKFTTNNTTYSNLWIRAPRYVTPTTYQTEVKNMILVKGQDEKSYIPYGKYGIEVETIGKNLLNFDDFLSAAGVSYTKEHNIFNVNSFGTLYSSPYKLNLKLNTKYTLSQTYQSQSSTNLRLEILKNGSIVGYSYATNSERTVLTFTTSNNINDVYTIRINYTTREYPMIFNKPMLEEEIQATEYEPYIGHNNLIVLNEPLRSIGDTKDLLYIKNGMLYVDRKIDSIILDGSENWSLYGTGTANWFYYISTTIPHTTSSSIYSNNYKQANITSTNTEQGIFIGNFIFRIRYGKEDTITNFKTWLSTHNTEVQYPLAEPYTEELGEVQIPSTYKGITHIDTTDELEPNMNITYVRDTLIANYVESHVSELKINEQGIEARVQTIEESDYGSRIEAVEERTTSTEKNIEIISTNIDTETGEIREVTTTNGITLNKDGLNLHVGQNEFNTQITNEATEYRDGNALLNKTSRNGSLLTMLRLLEQLLYSYNGKDTTDPMNTENYDFVDERVEADGEYCYATFYNGEE